MKGSGVEWLGQIPAHWDLIPLGKITLGKCDGPFRSGLKSEHYSDEGVRVIRLQNIRSVGFYGMDEAYTLLGPAGLYEALRDRSSTRHTL